MISNAKLQLFGTREDVGNTKGSFVGPIIVNLNSVKSLSIKAVGGPFEFKWTEDDDVDYVTVPSGETLELGPVAVSGGDITKSLAPITLNVPIGTSLFGSADASFDPEIV